MGFKCIDVSTWKRKETFDHYLNHTPCMYSMTLHLDATALIKEIRNKKIKLYPAMIYLLSLIVNKHEEFRTAIDLNGRLGIFDFLHPSYTVFQKEEEAFTCIWSEWTPSFLEFYQRYLADIQNYGDIKSFIAKSNMPANVFNISSIPWVSFTGFNLNLPKVTHHLLPIFTTGKYFDQNGRTYLPIAIQVHHAVCDGFHIARFVDELQEAMNRSLA